MRQPTKAELIETNEGLRRAETAASLCLTDIVNGAVEWFKAGDYSVGLCRPTCAAGGYVVVRFTGDDGAPFVESDYLDAYNEKTRAARTYCSDDYRDRLDVLTALLAKVNARVKAALDEKYAARDAKNVGWVPRTQAA